MSCISWSCRGLGTPWTVQFLTELVLQKKPNLIFLSEILCKKGRVERVKDILGFEGAVTVESQGHSGGLALIWRNKEEVNLRSFSKHYIDVEVSVQGWDKFRLTGLYGEPNRANRRYTWDLIRYLYQNSQLPWCIIGDMNNTLNHEDKKGGRQYPNWLLQGFRQAIEDCELVDLELKGYQFTWEKSYGTNEWIEVRLDRALVSHSFMNCFKNAHLTNLEITTSDHSPIMIEPVIISNVVPSKRFRFENAWLREPMCQQIVEETWRLYEGFSLQQKLAKCAESLQIWGQEITGSFKSRIKRSKHILKNLKGRRDAASIENYQEAAKQLHETYTQQEVFWKQRSKQLWLREGDSNSRFFHATTKIWRKTYTIHSLLNNNGQSVSWNSGLQELMIVYFSTLFKSAETEWETVVECVDRQITEEQNLELLMPVEEEEVKRALFSMHPEKSSGPDCMSPGFYQKYWNTVGKDLISLVKRFFDTASFDSHLTDTNIVLIPKKKCPVQMTDLRPISLCNVAYKVISKVLANRLKRVINGIISETQSAFIPGRLITDNIMLSYEVMHFMKRKTKRKKGWMALNLDMSKAYDRVEWGFLKAMLTKIGFSSNLVALFMSCVTSAHYQICHAGREFGSIQPERGIR